MTHSKIGAFHSGHDSSFAVLTDGLPEIHCEAERIIRIKNVSYNAYELLCKHPSHKDFLSGMTHIGLTYDSCQIGIANLEILKRFLGVLEEVNNKKPDVFFIGHHQSHGQTLFSSPFQDALIVKWMEVV